MERIGLDLLFSTNREAERSVRLFEAVTHSLYHRAQADVEFERAKETAEETEVHFRKTPSTINTASDNQSRVQSEQVNEWELHLKLNPRKANDLYTLVDDAFATVVHKWTLSHSVFSFNSNSHHIVRAREAARDATRTMSVTITKSENESLAVERATQRIGMEPIINGFYIYPNHLLSFYIWDELSTVECTSVVDVVLLLSLMVLRNGNTSLMETDYLHVLGVLDVECHSIPRHLLDYFPKPMPENGYATFRVREPSPNPNPSEPSTARSMYSCFRQRTVFPLGHEHFSFWDKNEEDYFWRTHNSFVAAYMGEWRSSEWTTAVYAIALEQEANNLQPSMIHSSRSNSATILDDRKKREAEIEFGDLILNWYPILAFSARGVYTMPTVLMCGAYLWEPHCRLAHLSPASCLFFVSRNFPHLSERRHLRNLRDRSVMAHNTEQGLPAPATLGQSSDDAASLLLLIWRTAKPTRNYFAAVASDLNADKLVREGSVFERGPHVPVTHFGYFRPPADAFLNNVKAKDGRSAKKWEYLNAAGVWPETGLAALSLIRAGSGDVEQFGRLLRLAEDSFKATLEVLWMRAQYFRDITEQGIETARQMSFLAEQGHDAVFSNSHRSAREALSAKLEVEAEVEAAKQLDKARMEKAKKDKGGQCGENTTGGTGKDRLAVGAPTGCSGLLSRGTTEARTLR